MVRNPYQFDPEPPASSDWRDPRADEMQPTGAPSYQGYSALAIISFVLSLLICLFIIGPALAIAFGATALIRIRGSRGRLRGQGLALAGTIIGAVMLLAHSCLGIGMWVVFNWASEQTAAVIRSVEAGDLNAVKRTLVPAQRDKVSQADLDAFAETLNSQFGSFQRCQVSLQPDAWAEVDAQSGSAHSTELILPFRLVFDQQEVLAIVVLDQGQSAGLQLVELSILLEEGDPLRFPPRQ